MSSIWKHFTKESPCPACSRFDWTCRAGDRAFVCMRVDSQFPSKDGGWFHFYNDEPLNSGRPKIEVEVKRIKKEVDFENYLSGKTFNIDGIDLLAASLGVSIQSLQDLHCFRNGKPEWAIPMRDGSNKIIGIQLRSDDGTKKCVTGSRGGLFIPQCETQKIAYICEGASSAAALLTMGFFAIGRFNCNSGGDMLKVCLSRLKINRVVVVADNDSLKSANDKTFRPGQDGARKLKKELGLSSCIFTCPNPVKDVRGLLLRLGVESARNYIKSSIENKVWTKG